jgi:hypothetical protein
MSTTDLTAAQVMDKVASLMNDTAKTTYTHVATLPYLNMALDELEEYFELNNVPVTNQTSAVVNVDIGETQINPVDGIGATSPPNYPDDLVEIQGLYERLQGSSDPFVFMSQREFLPHLLDDLPVTTLGVWIWQDQRIKFIGALTDREVKIDYIKKIFPVELATSSSIGVINARSFLYYRTAALVSQFIGENGTRAGELNTFAVAALERVTGISVKGKQSIMTRRRPFMASYKNRGY